MGGFGVDIWDLIGKPSGFDDEEERRRRGFNMSEASEPMQDVEDMPDEQSERPTIMAPRIVGTQDPRMDALISRYSDWQSRMPNREDYKASTGRKILGGLIGFLTGFGAGAPAGQAANRNFVDSKYNDALEDWQREGKSLGEVGALAQDVSETAQKREGNVLGYEGTQSRVEVQRQGVEQRKEAENLRHEDRMKNLTEDSARRAEVTRHNKALEGLAKEANRVRNVEATARTTAANAYSRRVDQQGAAAGQHKPLPAHYRQAVMDSIGEMMAADPYAARWFVRNPRDKSEIMVRPGLKIEDPNDLQRFRTFLERAKARAKKYLEIPPEEGDVEDYNPIRQEIP